ncbi:MAG: four-carbon acid sugar kinase family protein [Lacrimispora sp.]|uniref:3-oxo-tetronate kinase n=1 Tax=Lacrimispora sp. TaxID=2719234 RepID=UPI0039E4A8DA
MNNTVKLGCIADDFTGASDAASFLVKGGIRVLLVSEIPDIDIDLDGFDAVVIALKTRTMERSRAVKDTLAAVSWLKGKGVQQLYFKYCSTFDSTPKGNIGPAADAILEYCDTPYTILCPALPVNKRTVLDGRLYVNGVLLHESPMKNHPLTPMWAADIAELMEPQSQYPCMKLSIDMLHKPVAEIHKVISDFGEGKEHFYVIPDFVCSEDAVRIVEVFGGLPFLTGGSGIMEALGQMYAGMGKFDDFTEAGTDGKGLILSGSCSTATLSQVRYFINNGGKAIKMEPMKLLEKRQSVDDLWHEVEAAEDEAILIYSSDEADEVKSVQKAGREQIAELLEQTTAELAYRAIQAGYTRIVVAGGETSGAVTKRLGFSAYQISESVAPGVPVMIPLDNPEIRLVLKSGNFGQEDFFERAIKMTGR